MTDHADKVIWVCLAIIATLTVIGVALAASATTAIAITTASLGVWCVAFVVWVL